MMTYARTDDIRGEAVGIAQGDRVFKSEFARTIVATISFVESVNGLMFSVQTARGGCESMSKYKVLMI